MREIGDIGNELDASTFRDYLYNRGIEAQLEQNSRGRWSIWVEDENRIEEATRMLSLFTTDPAAEEFVRGADGAGDKRKDREQELESFARKQRNRGDVFAAMTAGGGTWITYVLMVACVGATVLASGEQGLGILRQLSIATTSLGLVEIGRGEVWRLVTPIFLHFGVMHILFNLMWLHDLGRMIEVMRGSWFFMVFVLVVAVMSNLAEYFMTGPAFGGMSGVVYAMLGFVWMQSRFNPWSGFVLHAMTVQMMLVWYVLCLTGLVGNIANTTHTVGLVAGVAWGYLDARRRTN